MLGLGSNISKTGKLGVHDLGIVTSSLVLKHNYDLSSVQPLSDGAAFFDGDDDYVELGSQSGDLRLSGSNGSIAAWVNPTIVGDDYQRIVDKSDGTDGANGYAFILHDDGTMQCSIDGSTTVSGSIVLTAQKWQHLAWTWDGTNHKLYVNGVLDVSNASSATPPSDTTNMRIGTWNHSTAREYKGYMCNVGIFEEALSQAQIKSIMNKNYAGLSDSEKTDLVSWWNLDSVIPDTTTLVYDNHHGDAETLGSELVTNSIFNSDNTSDWGNGFYDSFTFNSSEGGYYNLQRVTADARTNINLSSVLTVGKTYKVTVVARGSGNIKTGLTTSGYTTQPSAVFTLTSSFVSYSTIITVTSGLVYGVLWNDDGNSNIDYQSYSVKEINGNTGTLS